MKKKVNLIKFFIKIEMKKNIIIFLLLITQMICAQNFATFYLEQTNKNKEIINLKNTNNPPIFSNKLLARSINIESFIKNQEKFQIGDTIVLELFYNKTYKTIINKIKTDINHTTTINTNFVDDKLSHCFIFINDNNYFFHINIFSTNEQFQIAQHPIDTLYYLMQIDTSQLEILDGAPSLQIPQKQQTIHTNTTSRKVSPRYKALGINDTAKIDIMIVYTPEAKNWANSYDGGINNTISNIMANAELALDNSEIKIILNLVHSAEINYTESGSSSTDLKRLTFFDGYDPFQMENGPTWYMDEVHDWRNQYAADVVILLTKTSDTGGLSFLLENENGEPFFPFAIVRVQQATSAPTTAIHEIGHNMGCHHHKEQNVQPGPGIFPYSAGWRFVGTNDILYSDLMTYNSGTYFSNGLTSTKIPYFSNPLVEYQGTPTGNVDDGDNARTLNEMKHVIAAYRQPAGVMCQITTSKNYSSRGDVFGAGEYESGDLVELTATANNGYFFRDWSESGAVISTNPTYTFYAYANRELMANFSSETEPCIGGTQYPATTLTPTTTFQTQTLSAGDYAVFNVTSGKTYVFSLCYNDGAFSPYDSQLTLRRNDNNTLLDYNDNECGVFPKIIWTANFTGTVKLLVNIHDCETIESSFNLVYKQELSTKNVNQEEKRRIAIYPNPVQNNLSIHVEETLINKKFKIINTSGKTIYKGYFKTINNISTNEYSKGLYFITIENENEKIQFLKE